MPAPTSLSKPIAPKDLERLGFPRSVKWIRARCRDGGIPTLPPHKPPYLIPANVLFKFGMQEEAK